MADRLRDAVFGAAVGDALGVPFEFHLRGCFTCTDMIGQGTHSQPAGTWSDDTSMLIATCDSLRANDGKINLDDMRERFCAWLKNGAYTPHGCCFDAGGTTITALHTGRGCADERSNGNGSLMRIVPLAFTDASDDAVRAVSAITHAHWISLAACVMYVRIARALVAGEALKDAIAGVLDSAPVCEEPPFERLRHLENLSEDEVLSSGYVVHTLEAALWCLLHTSSYDECVLRAVNLGRDTDTTACVAGALAGIAYGQGAIPEHWLETLCAKDVIEATLF